MMTMDDTYSLITKAQSGSIQAMDELISKNSRLIWSIVTKYKIYGQDKDDLYQIGTIGFMKAIKNFNINLNLKLSTYAVPMISGEIKRFLRDSGPIKISRDLKSIYMKYTVEKDKYYKANGKEADINTISNIINTDKETLILAINANESVVYLDKPIANDNQTPVIEQLENPKANPENNIDRLTLTMALDKLDDFDKKIIKLRYIDNKTQSETGSIVGMSQVSISRTEKKILKKIREAII